MSTRLNWNVLLTWLTGIIRDAAIARQGKSKLLFFRHMLPIELELRAEVASSHLPILRKKLAALKFRRSSVTRRTSVMSFGEVEGKGPQKISTGRGFTDVRCRITNGRAEIVAKSGEPHAHNRTEVSLRVTPAVMLGMARLFGAMNFFTKVGSRLTENYKRGPLTVSLVVGQSGLAYVELEKMTDKLHEPTDLKELRTLAAALDLDLWETEKAFFNFCDRLNEQEDWIFHGTDKDMNRLKTEIKKIGAGRR